MPREPRYHVPGAFYHVIARGNQQQVIFHRDDYYQHYLSLLEKYSKKYSVTIHAYALMNNHVHLLVQEGPEPLSKFMQGVQQSYTQYVNKRLQQTGHLFQGRYKSLLIEGDEYLLALVRYIHLNPVNAGLATDPSEYRWSSHRSYFSGREDRVVQTAFVNAMVAQYRGREIADYRLISTDIPLSSLRTTPKDSEKDILEIKANREPLPLPMIIQQVATHTGLSAEEIKGRGRGRDTSQSRWLFIYTAAKSGHSLTEIAKYLDRGVSMVTMTLSRIDDSLCEHGEWEKKVAAFSRVCKVCEVSEA